MTATAPIGASERLGELDVLRGFALLGVFIVHFVASAFYALPLEDAQREAMRELPANRSALFVTEYLFYNKANTLFAVLFGMGFWVMMERLEQRGDDFDRIFLRRLTVLLAIGFVNIFLIFPGDVLHEYAAIGFLLYLLRRMPPLGFLVLGLLLAALAYPLADLLVPGADKAREAFDEVQRAAFKDGSYAGWVALTVPAHLEREILGGALFGWALYVLGRFLLGAWILRQGWIQRCAELQPRLRKLALVVLLAGLLTEGASMASYMEVYPLPEPLEDALHFIGVLVLAAGYALVLLALFHSRFRALAAVFAPVGRMALTTYVAHGVIFTLIFFPFGLGLLGRIGPALGMAIALGLFAAMSCACHWWLARYHYGPLEYLWRWATYGRRPQMKTA